MTAVSASLSERRTTWRHKLADGVERVRLAPTPDGWTITGTAAFHQGGDLCLLDYVVVCDPVWRTRSTLVDGVVAGRRVRHEIQVSAAGDWSIDGREAPEVAGCVDVDLNFSPSTNTLPIRRLSLAVGQSARVRAAWLRFPSFALEPLDQIYRRAAADRYRYESGDGSFTADISVDDAGLVRQYPPAWEALPADPSCPAS